MENIESEVFQFHQCRRIDGAVEPVDLIRRNRRPEIQFPADIVEYPLFTEAEQSDEYRELLDEVCQNLNDIERRTWLRIIDGRSILDIAAEEGVSRPAIYDRIKRMVEKNSYCAIWWRLKNKVNQHK
jgi:DNA-directed RNA polymerase specialized sigma24 family protein